jgi:hypothetical protein
LAFFRFFLSLLLFVLLFLFFGLFISLILLFDFGLLGGYSRLRWSFLFLLLILLLDS